MRRLSFILAMLLIGSACQQTSKKSEAASEELTVFTVDEIQQKGDAFVGKEVLITGMVSHVCKHGGERCFLMGSSEDATIRVEAGNQIGSFNQEQMGSDLKVKGILQEIRIDDAYVAEMVAELEEEGVASNEDHALGHDGEGNHEVDGGNHNRDQLEQIAEMREKIEATGKGYYSIFYLDGITSEELQ
ncbi:hypothetical protein [uncultured Sunxiuqinia sp.]|uniref:hypothetical protein n=1 Tax=Sunxiuqinia rutila TaxID=1397841 RepID=UPI00261CFAF6|nr:hypothetical protein [uncultured Sunxiuqinia sp.]